MKRKKNLNNGKEIGDGKEKHGILTRHPSPVTRHYLTLHLSPLLLALLSFTQVAAAFPWDYVNKNNEGIKKYFNKEYSEAELLFRKAQIGNPDIAQIKYNLADSLYKQGRYSEAQEISLDLLKENELDPGLKQKAFYNLGNIFYRMGEQKNPDMFWLNSLKQYESALKLAPEDREARENYDFVKKKLEQLNDVLSGKQNQNSNPEQAPGKDNVPPPAAYSNSSPEPLENKIFSMTKSETEEILQDQKIQEEGMQKFINRRQEKSKSSDGREQNPYLKDW